MALNTERLLKERVEDDMNGWNFAYDEMLFNEWEDYESELKLTDEETMLDEMWEEYKKNNDIDDEEIDF